MVLSPLMAVFWASLALVGAMGGLVFILGMKGAGQ